MHKKQTNKNSRFRNYNILLFVQNDCFIFLDIFMCIQISWTRNAYELTGNINNLKLSQVQKNFRSAKCLSFGVFNSNNKGSSPFLEISMKTNLSVRTTENDANVTSAFSVVNCNTFRHIQIFTFPR